MARTYPPLQERFWSGVLKLPGKYSCWRWTRGCSTLVNGAGRIYVHHLAYELCYGPVPEGWCVRRTCGTSTCVRPEHLEAFQQKGVTHPRAKLDAGQIREIRRRYKEGALVLSLAEEFGVSSPTISKIAHGVAYKDVE